MQIPPNQVSRTTVTVIGCLRPRNLTVILGAGVGLADGEITTEIPLQLVPIELRIPNTQFVVLIRWIDDQIIRVERRDE